MSELEPLTCERCGHDEFMVSKTLTSRRSGRWAGEAHEDGWVLVQLDDHLIHPRLMRKIERECERCGNQVWTSAKDWRTIVILHDEHERGE